MVRLADEAVAPDLLSGSTALQDQESLLSWSHRVELPGDIVARTTAYVLNVPYLDVVPPYAPVPEFVRQFPIGFAREHAVLAVLDDNGKAVLLMSGPNAIPHSDTVQRVLNRSLQLTFAPREEIIKGINLAYEQQNSRTNIILDSISEDEARARIQSIEGRQDLLETEGQAPVIELINLVLLEAVKDEASDVHFQPFRDHMVVRYRIDGVLFDAHKLPKDLQEEAVSRVKVMGNMNIAEKRLPQDGRASVTVGDRAIDLRIASLPGSYGERVVIRLLDKSSRVYALAETGMDAAATETFRHLIHQEHGLILLTGPTGSGKTTTLYAGLQELNQRERNIVTLEDPIEYDIDGISQTQINVKKGMTFASGLRSVLRQDPDVIMVGEIRDQETAALAIQSSLTGHLVFSTLHTNDAASAVTRLLHLGIEPYLVSSSLLAVLAQRLVRRVCEHCSAELSEAEAHAQFAAMNVSSETVTSASPRQGTGCDHCRNTGYRGRVAITELLTVENDIRAAIQERATASKIQTTARDRGMRLLREDGIDKVVEGITTVEEVARVTVRDI